MLDTTESEDILINNAFIILFVSNPLKDTVKIIVDGGIFQTTLKTDVFLKKIEPLCRTRKTFIIISSYSREYGNLYKFDRIKDIVEMVDIKYKDSIKNDLNKVIKQNKKLNYNNKNDIKNNFLNFKF